MSVYAYIRVSSDKQTCDNQHFSIKEYGIKNNLKIDKYIEETISSKKPLNKRKISYLINNIMINGDILIITEISRLARNLYELSNILQLTVQKNIKVISIKENYIFQNDLQSKIMAWTFGLSAEIERELISSRTKMSLDKLKEKNIKLGRPIGVKNKNSNFLKYKTKIQKLLNNGITQIKMSKILNISQSSISRYLSCLNQ